jgi:hypothetical protein
MVVSINQKFVKFVKKKPCYTATTKIILNHLMSYGFVLNATLIYTNKKWRHVMKNKKGISALESKPEMEHDLKMTQGALRDKLNEYIAKNKALQDELDKKMVGRVPRQEMATRTEIKSIIQAELEGWKSVADCNLGRLADCLVGHVPSVRKGGEMEEVFSNGIDKDGNPILYRKVMKGEEGEAQRYREALEKVLAIPRPTKTDPERDGYKMGYASCLDTVKTIATIALQSKTQESKPKSVPKYKCMLCDGRGWNGDESSTAMNCPACSGSGIASREGKG